MLFQKETEDFKNLFHTNRIRQEKKYVSHFCFLHSCLILKSGMNKNISKIINFQFKHLYVNNENKMKVNKT